MTAPVATPSWPAAPPAAAAVRFHAFGIWPRVLSGDVTLTPGPDGAWTLRFTVEGAAITVPVPAGQSFDAALQRTFAALRYETYPAGDMPAATPAPE